MVPVLVPDYLLHQCLLLKCLLLKCLLVFKCYLLHRAMISLLLPRYVAIVITYPFPFTNNHLPAA